MLDVLAYRPEMAAAWDEAVDASRNGTFLLKRSYMDYHADRFEDASAVVCAGKKVVAVLPASRHGTKIISHGGLTYGGLLMSAELRQKEVLEAFAALKAHFLQAGATSMVYKPVPRIFHRYPAEDDLYALFRMEARLVRRDASTAIFLPERQGYSELRKRSIKKAVKAGVTVAEEHDFQVFVALLASVLRRHDATPVHSADELTLLASRFPAQIRLYAARLEGELVAGILVFEKGASVHTQYLASSEPGRECGALDRLIDWLISERYSDRRYFSFGISTEEGGTVLNEGLIAQKEGFGGRTVVHDFYEWTLA